MAVFSESLVKILIISISIHKSVIFILLLLFLQSIAFGLTEFSSSARKQLYLLLKVFSIYARSLGFLSTQIEPSLLALLKLAILINYGFLLLNLIWHYFESCMP